MKQAEVEAKVERRPDFLHLSLGLSLDLQDRPNTPLTIQGGWRYDSLSKLGEPHGWESTQTDDPQNLTWVIPA